jgi:hypothetical protein
LLLNMKFIEFLGVALGVLKFLYETIDDPGTLLWRFTVFRLEEVLLPLTVEGSVWLLWFFEFLKPSTIILFNA